MVSGRLAHRTPISLNIQRPEKVTLLKHTASQVCPCARFLCEMSCNNYGCEYTGVSNASVRIRIRVLCLLNRDPSDVQLICCESLVYPKRNETFRIFASDRQPQKPRKLVDIEYSLISRLSFLGSSLLYLRRSIRNS